MPSSSQPPGEIFTPITREVRERQRRGNVHVHLLDKVDGNTVLANGGELGYVKDEIVVADAWEIGYLVIDGRKWLPSRKFLIPTRWVKEISWSDEQLKIPVPKEQIESSPGYDETDPLNEDDEMKLQAHYGKETWLCRA